MMMASPTAASPAATVMMKMVKICPSSDPRREEKATRLMLTALSISSMAISTVIMFRRMMTPTRPTANRVPESIRYASVLGAASSTERLLHFLLGLDALEDEVRRSLFLDGAELALADDDGADHGHEEEERRNLERHEVVPIQHHRHGLGVPLDHLMPHAPADDAAVGHVRAMGAIRGDALQLLRRVRVGIGVRPRPHDGEEEEKEPESDREAALPEGGEDALLRQVPDVNEHDHEEEEDHDAAGVDEHLHGADELGPLDDEEHGDAEEREQQEQRRVHRVAHGDDEDRRRHGDGADDQEDEEIGGHCVTPRRASCSVAKENRNGACECRMKKTGSARAHGLPFSSFCIRILRSEFPWPITAPPLRSPAVPPRPAAPSSPGGSPNTR